MGKYIESEIVSFGDIVRIVARLLRKNIPDGMSMKEIANKLNMTDAYFSNVLGSKATNNEKLYREIASAIGLSDKQFDSILEEAHVEYLNKKFPGAIQKHGMKYALSSELGDNPKALEEVQGFMQFIKQKYDL